MKATVAQITPSKDNIACMIQNKLSYAIETKTTFYQSKSGSNALNLIEEKKLENALQLSSH